MKKIFKYKLEITEFQEIEMPRHSHILCVQTQNGEVCLWALVDYAEDPEVRKIKIFGTGHPIEQDNIKYIGTTQQLDGQLMWHVFEET